MKKKPDIKTDTIAPVSVSRGALYISSFLCGASVMVLEMAGSRVVAPYMGTSQIVWTALIGVILTSMTFGNWAGGRLADRRPDPRVLAQIIMAAAVWSFGIGIFGKPFLHLLATSIRNLYLGALIAASVLFAVPSALLGAVSPFIVRLGMTEVVSSGATVGRYSAVSNAGSILGTFVGGLVLILFFSSTMIIFIVAATLSCVSLMLSKSARRAAAAGVLVLAAVSCEAGVMPMLRDREIEIQTSYNTVKVFDTTVWLTRREVRILQTDPLGAQSLMYLDDPSELYSDYTKFYDLAFHFRPQTKRVLMMGGGGYCVPRHITATRPDVDVDVVELDPGITKIARDHFFLKDRPGQRIFHEDARMYVNRESQPGGERYGAVFGDTFGSEYSIPFHLTTKECMGAIYDMLDDDGVLVLNIISEISGELFAGIYASVAEHFPSLMIFPATYPNSVSMRQNIMLVALKSHEIPEREPKDEETKRLLSHRWTVPYSPNAQPFTDDFAPVEKHRLKI